MRDRNIIEKIELTTHSRGCNKIGARGLLLETMNHAFVSVVWLTLWSQDCAVTLGMKEKELELESVRQSHL